MPAVANIQTFRDSSRLFKTAHFKKFREKIFSAMLVAFDRETPTAESS